MKDKKHHFYFQNQLVNWEALHFPNEVIINCNHSEFIAYTGNNSISVSSLADFFDPILKKDRFHEFFKPMRNSIHN